jgi:hypothetical protein
MRTGTAKGCGLSRTKLLLADGELHLSNLQPGTYAYQSGTHPQAGADGLYGAVTKDGNGQATRSAL